MAALATAGYPRLRWATARQEDASRNPSATSFISLNLFNRQPGVCVQLITAWVSGCSTDKTRPAYLVHISLLKQLICPLQSTWLVNCGSISKCPDAAIAALDAQVLICQQGPETQPKTGMQTKV